MTPPLLLLAAYSLDLAMGDPGWLPHPVRIMGAAISGADRYLRSRFVVPHKQRLAGLFLVIMIVLPAFFIPFVICEAVGRATGRITVIAGTAVIIYLTASTLAAKELAASAGLVVRAVKAGDLPSARRNLSMIVGRDTENLTEKEVLKAVTETLAENLSDGVVAPIFYLVLGGLPLAIAYKAVNTLDSMVGYKNETYLNFGRASARLDDVANYVPARIAGLLIVMAVYFSALLRKKDSPVSAALRAIRTMRRDGQNHTSPNSGVPEAAMAGGLGIRMGGPSTYGGVLVAKPYIGEDSDTDYLSASEDAIMVVRTASAVAVCVAAVILSLRSYVL